MIPVPHTVPGGRAGRARAVAVVAVGRVHILSSCSFLLCKVKQAVRSPAEMEDRGGEGDQSCPGEWESQVTKEIRKRCQTAFRVPVGFVVRILQ